MTIAPAPIRLVARLDGWRPMAKTDGPNAHHHWWTERARQEVVRATIAAALSDAGWQRDWGADPAGFVLRFTVFQKAGQLPDDDNQRGMLKEARDSTLIYLGWATQVLRRKGRHAGSGWMRAADGGADGIRFEYVWLRGRTDAVEIVLERGG